MVIKQTIDKKVMMQELIGKKVSVNFIFGAGELFRTEDIVKRGEGIYSKYFLQNQKLTLPLKYLTLNNDGMDITVNVPAGSSLSYQLNRIVNPD